MWPRISPQTAKCCLIFPRISPLKVLLLRGLLIFVKPVRYRKVSDSNKEVSLECISARFTIKPPLYEIQSPVSEV